MAIDNTPPRLKLIVTIAVIVLVTLFGLDFVFRSYYAYMSDQAAREKLAPTTALNEYRVSQQAALAGAKMDEASVTLANGKRNEVLPPKPSDDLSPLTGWSKSPKSPPSRIGTVPLPAPTVMPPDHHAIVDGGVAPVAADGGTKPTGVHAHDAGALH